MHALFVTVPDHGHLWPLLQIARQLQEGEEGVEVQLASMEHARPRVEAAGVPFLSLAAWSPDELARYQKLTAVSFDAATPAATKLRAVASAMLEQYGVLLSQGLLVRLEGARLPDVIVTDSLTLAGYEVAEQLGLPLVVVPQFPLSQALLMAGRNAFNLGADVPFESLFYNPRAGGLCHTLAAPLLKRLYDQATHAMTVAARNRVRARLSLPPLQGGVFEPQQPAIPRALFVCGCSWVLNARRPLPPNWHVVGPMGLSARASAGAWAAKDEPVRKFLQDAEEAGEAAVYVATGTMVTLQAHQVEALAAAAEALASQHRVRVIWSLKEASQQLLPAGMHSGGRILIVPFANQQAVLASPQVRAFVSHVGLGSTHEGLAAGKPMLALPFSGDQPTNAAQVVARGLGLRLNPSRLRAHGVTVAVLRLLREPGFAAAAEEAAAQLASEDGAATAARLVAQFCAGSE